MEKYDCIVIDPPWNQGKTGKRKAHPNQDIKWGFEFYTMITWNKNTGTCPFGPYQITSEYVIFAYKGKCVFNKESLGKMKTVFEAKKTIHSEKPDRFFELVNKYFKGDKIEIFARKQRDGFDGWGDEYLK